MSLVPHKIVALEGDTATAISTGKTTIASAVVVLYDSDNNAITLYDDAAFLNPAASKTTDSNGELVVFLTPGEYTQSVNGSTALPVTVGSASPITVDTFANMLLLRPEQTGQAFTCQERANAPYILKVSGYVALAGDATFANSRVAALQIDSSAILERFGNNFDTAIADAQTRCAGNYDVLTKQNWTTDGAVVNSVDFTLIALNKVTLTLNNNSNTHVINANGSTDFKLKGLKILGNKSNQSSGNGVLVGNGTTIEECMIEDSKFYGVYGFDKSNVTVRKNTIKNSDNIAIFIQAVNTDENTIVVEHNLIDREAIGTGVAEGGIKVRGNSSTLTINTVSICNNIVKMPSNAADVNSICIEIWGGTPHSVVSNNLTSGGSMCISLDESDGVACVGNRGRSHNKYGIEIAGSSNCTVSGNSLDGGSLGIVGEGIIISKSGSNNNAITGNTVKSFTLDGIHVASGNDLNSIVGNTVNHSGSRYGIHSQSSDDLTISGNVLNGNNTSLKAIVLQDSSNVSISGNMARDFTQHGIFLLSASGVMDNISIAGGVFFNCNGWIGFTESGSGTLGNTCNSVGTLRNGQPYNLLDIKNDVREYTTTGSPEGVWVGGIASKFNRRDGGAGTTLYIKESGAGNTGWAAL